MEMVKCLDGGLEVFEVEKGRRRSMGLYLKKKNVREGGFEL